jgi:hypothetical protein
MHNGFYATRHAALFGGNVTAFIECRSLNELFSYLQMQKLGVVAWRVYGKQWFSKRTLNN